MPTGPNDYLTPNSRGGRINRQRVRAIVAAAAELASDRLVALGLPPLPKTTPHALRRTYISIALVANSFDLEWVMSQVGHADSKMTMDVYAQLQQRVKREHGEHFDRLIRGADEQLASLSERPEAGSIGDGPASDWIERKSGSDGKRLKPAPLSFPEMARVGIEPTTPRFSVVCSTN